MRGRQQTENQGRDLTVPVLTAAEREESLRRYYERMVEARPIRARTRPEWLARRPVLRAGVQAALGLDPWPDKPPLEPVVTGSLERHGYRVERLYYTSWPGVLASGWLYLPEGLTGPAPAVLCPHGHWHDGALHPVVQSRCIGLARKGFVTLAVDAVHAYRYEAGVTPMTVMTWNNIRALDYLAGRADVDAARIGCTGASGGGQQTMYLMALDDRVRAAVPAVLVSYFHRILMPDRHHCPCNHVPGLLPLADEPEICALFAPRPLLFLTVTGDWTAEFPHEELLELRRIYHLYGQADRLEHQQYDGPHDYHQAMRERAYAWFLRWLCGVSNPEAAREGEIVPEPVETLAALARPPQGEPRWEAIGEEVARRVTFTAPRIEGRDARKSYQERLRSELEHLLGMTAAARVAPQPEVRSLECRDGCQWERLVLRSERDILVPAIFARPEGDGPSPVVLLLGDDGKVQWLDESGLAAPLQTLLQAGYAVFLPDVRLRGELHREWLCNSILWGRPEAGMAATDLQATLDYLSGRADVEPRQLALIGLGESGLVALLAAGLDERVAATIADTAGTTYQDGGAGLPVIPNILRHADTPQIASLCAPRPLWLLRVPRERAGFSSRRYFDWTLRSFQSLGARDAVRLDTRDELATAEEWVPWLDQALRRRRG
jgi:dienelactone hydrolase